MTLILPPAAPVVLTVGPLSSPDNNNVLVEVGTLVLNRRGYWQVFVSGTVDQFATNSAAKWAILVDGVGTVVSSEIMHGQTAARVGGDWRGMSDGTTIARLQSGRRSDGFSQTIALSLTAVFIPTATAIK